MFSSRLEWGGEANRIAAAVSRRRAAGAPLLDLTESNPTTAQLRYDVDRIASALRDPKALSYEPTPWGLREAREAVAAYYRERGFAAEPGRILLTASTSEAYAYLFKLLCDAGDRVLVPRPSYPLFEFLARLENVDVAQYPLFYDHGWHVDLDGLRSLLTPRTRAVVLVNPNNPTGSYLKRSEHVELQRLCLEQDLAIISDEVFSDYAFGDDRERVCFAAEASEVLAFSLSGLSKTAGLPQVKLGWIIAGGPTALAAAALERLELIADTYLSVGTPVQTAAARLMAAGAGVREQIRVRTRRNLELLRGRVRGTALGLLAAEGGWYATLQMPRVRTEEEWVLGLLEQHGVLVQPGFFYDFASEAFLVLSLLTPEPVFAEGVARLLAYATE